MDSVERRSAWGSLLLSAYMAVMMTGVGIAVAFWLWNLSGRTQPYSEFVASLGVSASGDLVAALALIVPIQIALLVATVSGRILAKDEIEEVNTRSALQMIAFLPGALITPAVIFSTIAATHSLEVRGELFVVIPLYLLQLGVGIFIGTFELGSLATLIKVAESQSARAAIDARRLRATLRLCAKGERKMRGRGKSGSAGLMVIAVVLTALEIWSPTALAAMLTSVWLAVANTSLGGSREIVSGSILLAILLGIWCLLTVAAIFGVNSLGKPKLDQFGVPMMSLLAAVALVAQVVMVLAAMSISVPLGIGAAISTLLILGLFALALIEAKCVRRLVKQSESSDEFTKSFRVPLWIGGLLMRAGTVSALEAAERSESAAERRISELKARRHRDAA